MKKTLILVLMLAVLLTPAMAFAASPWTEEDTYSAKATEKLSFGVKNVLGGWTQIFSRAEESQADGKGPIIGFGKGLYEAVVYTVGGAIHAVTFLIPVDLPLPNNGV